MFQVMSPVFYRTNVVKAEGQEDITGHHIKWLFRQQWSSSDDSVLFMVHKQSDVYFITNKAFKVSTRTCFSLEYTDLVLNTVYNISCAFYDRLLK
jgi:hypothetical protein